MGAARDGPAPDRQQARERSEDAGSATLLAGPAAALDPDALRAAILAGQAPSNAGLARLLRSPVPAQPPTLGLARRPRKSATPGAAPPEANAQERFDQNVKRLRTEVLPAFQAALDAIDAKAVEAAGTQVLMLWSAIDGAQAELTPEGGGEPQSFGEIRTEVLGAITTQRFKGEGTAGAPVTVEHTGQDVGPLLATRVADAGKTVSDAATVYGLVFSAKRTYDDEQQVVQILRRHPNPWELGYVRSVLKSYGVDGNLDAFHPQWVGQVRQLFEAQDLVLKAGKVRPGDKVGLLQALPHTREVRVIQPYEGRALAEELYGTADLYETVLVPYNRAVLANLGPEDLVPAGTQLLVEPTLVAGRYRTVFMALEQMRAELGKPYITGEPDGSAAPGTKLKYTLRLPRPIEPLTLQTAGGLTLLNVPNPYDYALVDWEAVHDPALVESKGLDQDVLIASQVLTMADMQKSGTSVEHQWPADLGTHTVRASIGFRPFQPMDSTDPEVVEYRQPVLSLDEKLEADWLGVEDPRELYLQTAETYGEFQLVAERVGVTPDELAANPHLAGRLGTKYYPEFLLRDLRKQLETATGKRQGQLKEQVGALEKAMVATKAWGMRPLDALYVSGKDERTTSIPLMLYVSPDPQDQWPVSLRLWDFTIPGDVREYEHGRFIATLDEALRGLLAKFADDAPYPTGRLRIRIDSTLFPEDFAGVAPIRASILDLKTDGGMLLERLAPLILMAGAAIVGSALAGPTVALTALAVYGGVSGFVNIVQRLEEGDFDWDVQTGMDLLSIAGALLPGAGAVMSAVKGVGQVGWLMTAAKVAGYSQLGVMAGVHLNGVLKALHSGDRNDLLEALLSAVIDGALFVVMHKAGKIFGDEPGAIRPGGDPADPRTTVRVPGLDPLDLPDTPGGGRPSTSVGVGGGKTPPPPGERPLPPEPKPDTPEHARWVQERWARGLSETGLAPREGVAPAGGPEAAQGTFETVKGERVFSTPEAAFKAYDEAVARAGGREVGIYRNANAKTGEYVVRVGDAQTVRAPLDGNWESVLHRHPNPENVLTRRMPAPQDVQNPLHGALQPARAVAEFIDYPLPDGRRGLVAYTVEPVKGRVTIQFERVDGTRVTRTFESIEAYATHYGERTTYVDPKSTEYEWMKADIDEFYRQREPDLRTSTATGTLKPGAPDPTKGEPAKADAVPVEGPVERPGGAARPGPERPAHYEAAEKPLAANAMHTQIKRGLVGDEGFAVQGAKLADAGKGSDTYTLTVPKDGGVEATVRVRVRLVAPDENARAADGSETAQESLTPPAKPGDAWVARIDVPNSVRAENVRTVVGREIDEIAGIVRRAPDATPEQIAALKKPGVFTRTPEVSAEPTPRDHAAARELYDIHQQREVAVDNRNTAAARLDGKEVASHERTIRRHTEAMSKLIESMGLDLPDHVVQKSRVLQAQGRGETWLAFVREVQQGPADAALATHRGTPAGAAGASGIDAELVRHMMFPQPHAPDPVKAPGVFKERGINGGHVEAEARAFAADGGYPYALVETRNARTAGGATFRYFEQYMWEGNGPQPAAPTTGGPHPGWARADVPKTTFTDLAVFMREAEAVIAASRGPGGALPEGRFAGVSPGGVHVAGFARGGRVTALFVDEGWF